MQTGGTIAQLQLGGSVTLNGGTLLVNKHASLEVGSKGGAQIGTITVDAGSTIAGSGTLTGGSLLLNGTVDGKGSGLTIIDDISGTGSLVIDANSRVTAEAAVASSVVFAAGGGETLALAQPKSAAGTLSGFGSHDTIDLQNVVATSLSFAGGTLTVKNGSTIVASLKLTGTYTNASFSLNPDGHGGSAIRSTGLLLAPQRASVAPAMHDHGASSAHMGWVAGLADSHLAMKSMLVPFDQHTSTGV